MNAPEFRLESAPLADIAASWLVVAIKPGDVFSEELQALDHALGGMLTRLRERGDLKGKAGELTTLPVLTGVKSDRLMVIGLGDRDARLFANWEQGLLAAARASAGTADSTLAIAIPPEVSALGNPGDAIATAVCAALIGSSGQGLYKSSPDRFAFKSITVVTGENNPPALERGRILGNAVNLTRELVNRHPEEIVPLTFAQRAADEASSAGIECEIFDLPRLQQERMGALLAVGRGSSHEPRVVVYRYRGADESAPWLALCGKGVTYDSGGLSIKPSDSMIGMKADMAGAATVLGAITALARLKAPVNVLGVMGLVENMLGPHSYKLGEVLTARNGTTIEVHNTDAEGRLVLADVLAWAVDQQPARMIDLATLTGACMVALGPDVAGAFTNDQPWCDEVLSAARRAGEELWQLPMHESYAEQLKCDFADVKNVGTRWGGAITAAKFLEKFVGNVPWVHLDIAGPSFADNAKSYRDAGATGSSLRTLVAVAEAFAASPPAQT